jgi:hypothetical protein
MKSTALRITCIAALLLIPAAFATQEDRQGHLSGLKARITLADGTIRTATIEGLGCSEAICSRVAIRCTADDDSLVSFWLDGIAAIKDTTGKDVLVVMKNGAARRVSLVKDFRVLYLANRTLSSEKLDLGKIRSLEFLPAAN